jgi:dephospho-CoA kinase
MLRVGLTGGIGCGKTTVAAMMGELGCHILEADALGHQVIAPGGPAYEEVVREFGREILAPDGRIARPTLAAIVFAHPDKLSRLNSLVHPPLLAAIDRELARLESADPGGVAVIDAALLIEFNHYNKLDRIVVVWCTPEQQLARLTDPAFGRALPREQAQSRIAAQIDLAQKRQLADDVIDCSGTIAETRRQVEALVADLKHRAASAVH